MYSITKYYNGNSDIHIMNPLIKLICLIIFTFLVLYTKNIYILLLLLLFVIYIMITSKVPLKLYIKNLTFSIGISIFILIINMIFKVPLLNSIISILKLILFLLYSGVLVYTTTPNDLTYGLEKLFSPLRFIGINPNKIAMTLSLAISFIPIIFKELNKIVKAAQSRGLKFDGTIKERCDKILSIIIPTFSLSIERADKVADTLDIRLYDCTKKRSKYKLYNMHKVDESILLMHILLLIIVIVGDFI